jgi:hypothetical protein
MIHNKKYPKDEKYVGIHCQYKIYGDTLPIQNIWGHIANTKHMGTHCQYKTYGDTLPIQNMGTHCQKNIWGPFTNIAYKIFIHKNNTMHGMRTGVHSTLGSSPGNNLILILLSFLGNVTSLFIMWKDHLML